MGVYANVNGVIRKVPEMRVGVNGAVRSVKYGFCGVGGVRRQFFGPLEDVVRVEVVVQYGRLYDLDSSGNKSNGQTFYSAGAVSPYGAVSISGNTISVSCKTPGKYIVIYGYASAVFANGRNVNLAYLSENYAQYGASISFPISFSSVAEVDGVWLCNAMGYKLSYEYTDKASGNKTLTAITDSEVCVGDGIKRGSGRNTTQISFSNITIDGRSVPVNVVSKLS